MRERRGRAARGLWLVGLGLLAGCAAAGDPGGEPRYGAAAAALGWRLGAYETSIREGLRAAELLRAAHRTDVERIPFWRGHVLRSLADLTHAEGDSARALALGREAVNGLEERRHH